MSTEKSCGAFTQRFPALSNKLTSKAQAVWKGKSQDAVALWDTGATVTCISTALAKELRLVATGGRTLRTPAGSKIVNTYLIDIVLPNEIRMRDVVVCDSTIGQQGFDILIGMDIIQHGDLSVSNFNGQTMFSFRTPSKEATDYSCNT